MPQPFTTLHGLVVPLDRANVDTDAIIPKQFMKSIRRTGFGDNLFDAWRYLDPGEPGQDCSTRPLNAEFVLNQPRYRGAQILLARENFGCGSSREHAPWALRDFGIRAIVATSFGDIFQGNCVKNGLLPVVLEAHVVQALFEAAAAHEGFHLSIDLALQTVTMAGHDPLPFHIDSGAKHNLLEGLDEIALTLRHADRIRAHERERRVSEPWLFVR
jgi:3-isopropylmalate/(R)-2-methylmalate dehydratase small subunit